MLADPSCKPHETNKFNILDLSFYITTFTLLLRKFGTNSPSKTNLFTVLNIGPLLPEKKSYAVRVRMKLKLKLKIPIFMTIKNPIVFFKPHN